MLFAKDEAVASDISRNEIRVKKLNSYSKFVVALSLIVVLTNAAQALISNGIPPFSGKGDPERVSLNNTLGQQEFGKSPLSLCLLEALMS